MSEDLTPGKRIKQVRESMGFTQVQFAKLIAVQQPSLARIESDRSEPSMTIVRFVELIATLQPSHDWFKLESLS